MVIEIHKGYPKTQDTISSIVREQGNSLQVIQGNHIYDTLHVLGDIRPLIQRVEYFSSLPGVKNVLRISSPYKNINRIIKNAEGTIITRQTTVIEVPGPDGYTRTFGTGKPVFLAGPDSVQTWEQLKTQAVQLKELAEKHGILDRLILRAGAFKPRTRPTDFRGMGMAGVDLLVKIREELGVPFVTEVMDHTLVPELAEKVDMFQIGTRNAQDFNLLEAVGKTQVPVILKRGFGNDATEWFHAAEYIANQGNHNIILCERGVKTMFAGQGYNRFTPDFNIIRYAQENTVLPIIFDPSHAAGQDEIVPGNLLASLAFGADGTITETIHDEAFRSIQECDARQAFPIELFDNFISMALEWEKSIEPQRAVFKKYFANRSAN